MSGPTKDEDPTVAAAGLQGLAQSVNLNSAASAADDKAFFTCRALLAREGHALSRTDANDGKRTYFVSRWGMVRELRDLAAIEAFARQVGGLTHG